VLAGLVLAAAASTVALAARGPTDPAFVQSPNYWGLLDAPAAWRLTTGSPKIVIAIVDTGIKPIPDLRRSLVPGWNVITGTARDTTDELGHGTAVASTAAAPINGIGTIGLCPSCRLMPIKVVVAGGPGGRGRSTAAWVASGIRKAVELGARVINVSIGASRFAPVVRAPSVVCDAVRYAVARGRVVVMGAGNFGSDKRSADVYASTCSAAIRVGGVNNALLAADSDYGSWVDVAALWTFMTDQLDGSYNIDAGTSFSTPQVSGIVGLMLAHGVAPGDVKRRLMRSCGPEGIDVACGGVVDAARAVSGETAKPRPPAPKRASFTVVRTGAGTVVSSPAGIVCGSRCTASFVIPRLVRLVARPAPGYGVARWNVCSGKPTACSLWLTGNVTVDVAFARKS
jgi:subtilisin family serine protease